MPKWSADASREHRSKSNLSQRTLEIEAGIRRLLGRDRPVGRKQSAPEHMIAGTIDGLDADELSCFVAKGRERSRGTVATYHHAVIAGGQPHHLQLVGALIAPEPRQPVIGLGIAGQPGRYAAGVVGGVLHRLQPQ